MVQNLYSTLEIGDLLKGLYPGLSVEDVPKKLLSPRDSRFAVFLSDDDLPVAIAAFDHNFAAFTGAALTMIPVDAANEEAASGQVPDSYLENVAEVMNILSRAFMRGDSPHLRFSMLLPALASLDERMIEVIKRATSHRTIRVDVPGYGQGLLALISS